MCKSPLPLPLPFQFPRVSTLINFPYIYTDIYLHFQKQKIRSYYTKFLQLVFSQLNNNKGHLFSVVYREPSNSF